MDLSFGASSVRLKRLAEFLCQLIVTGPSVAAGITRYQADDCG